MQSEAARRRNMADVEAELLATRLILATIIWKSGGSVNVTEADVQVAAMTCELHAQPSLIGEGATKWFVTEMPSLKTAGN